MKKVLVLLLALVTAISITACSGGKDEKKESSTQVAKSTSVSSNETKTEATTAKKTTLKGTEGMLASHTWSTVLTKVKLVFNDDHTYEEGSTNGTWSAKDKQVTMKWKDSYDNQAYTGTFDILEDDQGNTYIHGTDVKGSGGTITTMPDYYYEDVASAMRNKSVKQLGSKASTDIIDFTLEKAKFSYYASASSDSWAKPLKKSDDGIFTAATGRVYVCMTFKIKNKDRGDSINIGPTNDWQISFRMKYKDEWYIIKGYDLNDKDGKYEFGFDDAAINGIRNDSDNIILQSGESVKVRIVGVAQVDPDKLSDPFELYLDIPNSDGEEEEFCYEVK